jgi:acyl-CoA thioester hydrolase
MEGRTHVLPLRVYYEDTDAAGMVYYANYLRFIERARTDMMRLAGVSHSEMREREELYFTVHRCEVDYLSPARLDDELEVHTRLLKVSGATLRAEQIVKRDGDDLVRSEVRIACVGSEGRPRRLPGRVRALLSSLCQPDSES